MTPHTGPHTTFLYRLVSFFTRRQAAFLVRRGHYTPLRVALFVFGAGAIALGIISMVASLTRLPLVFPPLAASAFILFNTPLAERASPRSVVLAHGLALVLGLGSLHLMLALSSQSTPTVPELLTWAQVGAIALSMGLTSVAMIALRCVHPPAAATALIAAMGYVGSVEQAVGFIVAVVLLVIEAWILNRVVGGLPYPWWRWRPEQVLEYRSLAGYEEDRQSFWTEIRTQAGQRRSR